MQDVAVKAGVSKTTVSHALNGTRPVEKSTLTKITDAVRELGYVPNQAARSLNGKGFNTLGMIITDIRESFYSQIVKAMEAEAARLDFNIMICSSEDSLEKERASLELLSRKGVDLLIHSPVHKELSSRAAAGTGIPVIELDRISRDSSAAFVGIPNREAAARSAEVLAANGSRFPGMISFPETVSTMEERCRGFLRGVEEAGLYQGMSSGSAYPPILYTSSRDPEKIKIEIKSWIREYGIDGLLCGNETVSLAAVQAVQETGMNIPGDIRIIGFDDNPWMAFLNPPLSVVRQPTARMAEELAELIRQRLSPDENEIKNVNKKILVPAELVLRGSCGSDENRIISIKGERE